MIPLNQSYQRRATFDSRADVCDAFQTYEAWARAKGMDRIGRSYDYALILAGVDVTGLDVLELGARDSYFSPYVTRWAKQVTVTDLFGRQFHTSGSLEEWRDTWTSLAENPDRLTVPAKGVDMRALPYGDKTFDLVVNISAIEHVPGEGDIEAVREMARVCKPGGYVAIGTDTSDRFRLRSGYYYDEKSLYSRLIKPSKMELHGPADLSWEPCDKSPHKSGEFDRSCCLFVLKKTA